MENLFTGCIKNIENGSWSVASREHFFNSLSLAFGRAIFWELI